MMTVLTFITFGYEIIVFNYLESLKSMVDYHHENRRARRSKK
jgi:hypothetical protein